ncbi:hypothetical protein [Pseudescherichia vulneris]
MKERTFWQCYGRLCKPHTRTYAGSRFYYGSMSLSQNLKWRDAP